jgi:hypothetical protein
MNFAVIIAYKSQASTVDVRGGGEEEKEAGRRRGCGG